MTIIERYVTLKLLGLGDETCKVYTMLWSLLGLVVFYSSDL